MLLIDAINRKSISNNFKISLKLILFNLLAKIKSGLIKTQFFASLLVFLAGWYKTANLLTS